jgi:hypothetical protein
MIVGGVEGGAGTTTVVAGVAGVAGVTVTAAPPVVAPVACGDVAEAPASAEEPAAGEGVGMSGCVSARGGVTVAGGGGEAGAPAAWACAELGPRKVAKLAEAKRYARTRADQGRLTRKIRIIRRSLAKVDSYRASA